MCFCVSTRISNAIKVKHYKISDFTYNVGTYAMLYYIMCYKTSLFIPKLKKGVCIKLKLNKYTLKHNWKLIFKYNLKFYIILYISTLHNIDLHLKHFFFKIVDNLLIKCLLIRNY